MKNDRVDDARHLGKTSLLQWLCEATPAILPKVSSIKRGVMAAVFIIALVAPAAMIACGTEETAPDSDSERPAAQTADRADPEPSGSTDRIVAADASTPTNGRQSTKDDNVGTTDSGASGQGIRAEPTGSPITSAANGQSGQAEQPAPTGEQLDQAEYLYVEAELYLLVQRFHRAAHSLNQAIAINPNLAEAYTLRGFARTMMRDYDGAMKDFEKALEMEAENAARAYAFRSHMHSEMGNYEDALADAETAHEMAHPQDQFALADAYLARLMALYRSGGYDAIDTHSLQQFGSPQGSTNEVLKNLAPYGLGLLYGSGPNTLIERILESDAHLLLNPDDADFLSRRGVDYYFLGWYAKAVQDLNKAIELTEVDRRGNLYKWRAIAWAKMGNFEAIIQNAEDLEPSRDIWAGASLAIAYWNLGDVQKATDAITAFDYKNIEALFVWDKSRPIPDNIADRSTQSREITEHLAIKGALLAAQGQLEEGLKYLNITACNEWIIAADAVYELPPVSIKKSYRNIDPLKGIAAYEVGTWVADKQSERQWDESRAKTMWEWCGYPDEFVAGEDGMFMTLALPLRDISFQQDSPLPFRTAYNQSVSHPNFLDPIVIASSDPDLHHYMAAWYQSGLSLYPAIDMMHDIDQAIELGADNPNAYLIKAKAHLAWALGLNPRHRPDGETRQSWMENHYNQSVDAYTTYESLATPHRWEAAKYHFVRGKILGQMERKQEAQSAYQQAFQHGVSEEIVKEALLELNR